MPRFADHEIRRKRQLPRAFIEVATGVRHSPYPRETARTAPASQEDSQK
jgi:hypothetical protein